MWKPKLVPEVEAELELHGVDAERAYLAGRGSLGGTQRHTLCRFGNVALKRGELEDWLKWKAASDDRWVKVGTVAAIVAAILAFPAWRFPAT